MAHTQRCCGTVKSLILRSRSTGTSAEWTMQNTTNYWHSNSVNSKETDKIMKNQYSTKFRLLRPSVYTSWQQLEFDILLRSMLSPKLNMFNSIDFVESRSGWFLSQVCPNARMSNVISTFGGRSQFDKIDRAELDFVASVCRALEAHFTTVIVRNLSQDKCMTCLKRFQQMECETSNVGNLIENVYNKLIRFGQIVLMECGLYATYANDQRTVHDENAGLCKNSPPLHS